MSAPAIGSKSPITAFIKHHYRHFNAAVVIDAAEAYVKHLAGGGKMFVTLAGAMSTAELGLSLAEMIRQDKVHGICCTGANLEEDVFNLVAHDHYERVPHYRDSHRRGTGAAGAAHEPRHRHLHPGRGGHAPHRKRGAGGMVGGRQGRQAIFPARISSTRFSLSGKLKQFYQIDPKDSWLMAAAEKNLPMFVPGWEDSTLGNMYAAQVISGNVKNVHTVRGGIEYMIELAAGTPRPPTKTPSASSRSAAASRRLSHLRGADAAPGSAARPTCRSGPISARSAIPPPATVRIPAPCPTKKSPGASWAWTRRSTSSSPTPPSWRR